MLELHRVDLRIIEAAAAHYNGATIVQIHESMDDPVSIDSIKRHLPGLVRLRCVEGVKAFRDEKLVTLWLVK